jgi:hypothetical protein
MSEPFTREERNDLLRKIRAVEAELYPKDGSSPPRPKYARLRDTYYAMLGEYSDRLPRVLMSVCPFTGAPLVRSIDPYGLDGFWWHKDRTFTPEEPAAPPTFRVLLGALDLRGRTPSEASDEVLAGPAVPFVVPRLLELPGMVAVVSRLELASGDVAYPIAYFSSEETPPFKLHQFWTRPELWFETASGSKSWLVRNDPWDFDLETWIAQDKLKWVPPGQTKPEAVGGEGGACPFIGLAGDRQPQVIGGGVRELDEAPTGEPVEPFET